MTNFRERMLNRMIAAEARWDALRARRRREGPFFIDAYEGYGALTPQGAARVRLRGRVLQGAPAATPEVEGSAWQNLVAAYRRLESDEVAGATVEIALGGQAVTAGTDAEGFYDVTLELPAPDPAPWQEGRVRLLAPGAAEAPARALVPRAANFAVVSDIDDTILVSEATSALRAARLLLFKSARGRAAFAGVSEFYAKLQQGAAPGLFNPIAYVSSSPWNLYPLLSDFLALNDIPAGPLFLRDYGLDAHTLQSADHHAHKRTRIEELMAAWPALPFVLIGDSGQQDPEIYAALAAQRPDRVRAVYIRAAGATSTRPARAAAVRALAAPLEARGVPWLLFDDTAEAQAHARALGLIAERP